MKFAVWILLFLVLSNQEAKVVEILHCADIHLDIFYDQGSPDSCLLDETGLGCCRFYSVPKNDSQPAHYFGSYKCDSPIGLVELTIYTSSRDHPDVVIILYSGDSANHHDLSQTYFENLMVTIAIVDKLRGYFPYALILPVLGNHDAPFVDQFDSQLEEHRRFLGEVCKKWNWIKDPNLCKYGFYAFEHQSLPNTKVLGLNSVIWEEDNIIGLLSNDSKIQWEWLTSQLRDSRAQNQHVWLHMHIPPGSSYIDAINDAFEPLISNLTLSDGSPVVSAIFTGHTHNSEFRVLKNSKEEMTNMVWSAPSVVPSGHYPGYRVYEANGNLELVNYSEYYLNLSKVHHDNRFQYNYLYDMQSAYNVSDLSLSSMRKVVGNLLTNDTAMCDYLFRYNMGYPEKCIPEKRKALRCDILHTTTQAWRKCMQ
jgi:hypothetical protein